MKAGNLVRITRASIACPKGTIGLIVEIHNAEDWDTEPPGTIVLYDVQLAGSRSRGRTVRRLARDLEVVSK